MANQFGAVTDSKRPRDQAKELEGRLALLPTIIANKNRATDIARQEDQFGRQHALAQSQFDASQKQAEQSRQAADRASQVDMGLSAAKLGTTIGLQHGDKTVGGIIQGTKNMWNGTPGATANPSSSGWSNFGNSLSVGSAVGGGLAGFGASQLLGKKSSKVTKGLVGAGVGGFLGLLGGGAGGAVSGGFGGFLGSLFG